MTVLNQEVSLLGIAKKIKYVFDRKVKKTNRVIVMNKILDGSITQKQGFKNCTRCQGVLRCETIETGNCQCAAMTLNKETQEFIDKTNYNCLCAKCLATISEMVHLTGSHVFPKRREMLVEGLHYYKENGFWVFTEFYHLLRGRCCQNGCRHCAYGFISRKV